MSKQDEIYENKTTYLAIPLGDEIAFLNACGMFSLKASERTEEVITNSYTQILFKVEYTHVCDLFYAGAQMGENSIYVKS